LLTHPVAIITWLAPVVNSLAAEKWDTRWIALVGKLKGILMAYLLDRTGVEFAPQPQSHQTLESATYRIGMGERFDINSMP